MNNVHKLTEGAVLLAVFAVLLLISLYVPILGTVSVFFLALPFIMFAAKNNRMGAIVFLTGGVLLSLIIGSIMGIPLALTFGLTGTVIGIFIKEIKDGLLPLLRARSYSLQPFCFSMLQQLPFLISISLKKASA